MKKLLLLFAVVLLLMATPVQLDAKLNEKEVGLITEFLKTTTGVQPKVVYPILPASTDATPKPVLDY